MSSLPLFALFVSFFRDLNFKNIGHLFAWKRRLKKSILSHVCFVIDFSRTERYITTFNKDYKSFKKRSIDNIISDEGDIATRPDTPNRLGNQRTIGPSVDSRRNPAEKKRKSRLTRRHLIRLVACRHPHLLHAL